MHALVTCTFSTNKLKPEPLLVSDSCLSALSQLTDTLEGFVMIDITDQATQTSFWTIIATQPPSWPLMVAETSLLGGIIIGLPLNIAAVYLLVTDSRPFSCTNLFLRALFLVIALRCAVLFPFTVHTLFILKYTAPVCEIMGAFNSMTITFLSFMMSFAIMSDALHVANRCTISVSCRIKLTISLISLSVFLTVLRPCLQRLTADASRYEFSDYTLTCDASMEDDWTGVIYSVMSGFANVMLTMSLLHSLVVICRRREERTLSQSKELILRLDLYSPALNAVSVSINCCMQA